MIYAICIYICVSVILVIGQPRTYLGAMVNRAMMVMIASTFLCAALWYVWGISIKEIIERSI